MSNDGLLDVDYIPPTDSVLNFGPGPKSAGIKVFVADPEEVWEPAVVQQVNDDGTCVVKSYNNKRRIVPGPHLPYRDDSLDTPEGEQNMSHLVHLHEGSLLQNLNLRFSQDLLYTYTGCMLIAMNPFKWLPIYGPEFIEQYRDKNLDDAKPHAYAVAEKAYRCMRKDCRDQSILVSGESGAGKTETAKIIMNYLAAVSGSLDDSSKENVADRVLKSNPILEAFGNAKTVRNNNSSRFGKFIDIQFSRTGKVVGANIRTYLLEKSRVVRQAPNERNYHIFYQLCLANPDAIKGLGVPVRTPDKFVYLNQGKVKCIEGKSDIDDWRKTSEAMDLLGITAKEKTDILRVLLLILYLGELEFVPNPSREDHIALNHSEATKHACTLLGCTKNELEAALVIRSVTTRNETIQTPNNLDQCGNVRDGMTKEMYKRLFDWLVKRINESIVSKQPSSNFIGVLDIFGFESFVQNSFEQLCINFANEKLQQLFITNVLKNEQVEYEQEHVVWQKVEYNDNQEVVELIEKKGGLLTLLDEECLFPRGSDETWTSKIKDRYTQHRHFRVPQIGGRGKKSAAASRASAGTPPPNQQNQRVLPTTPPPDGFDFNKLFGIAHYAREVWYDTSGFLEKNKDQLSNDATQLLNKVSFTWLNSMFQVPSGGTQRAGALQTATVGSQFKEQLLDLMGRLAPTVLHYVSCIKPNSVLKPNILERQLVVGQLRCAGVLEAIQVSRKMYPFRSRHDEFYNRYRCLLKLPKSKEHADGCKLLVSKLLPDDTTKHDIQIGRTKVFMMQPPFDRLENRRTTALHTFAKILQSTQRMHRRRVYFLSCRHSAVLVQCMIRFYLARVELIKLMVEKAKTAVIPIAEDEELPEQVDAVADDVASVISSRAPSPVHMAKGEDKKGFMKVASKKKVAHVKVTERRTMRQTIQKLKVLDDAQLFELHCNDLHYLIIHSFDNHVRLQGFQGFYAAYSKKRDKILTCPKLEDPELVELLVAVLRKGSGDPSTENSWSALVLGIMSIFAMSEKNCKLLYELQCIQRILTEMDRWKQDELMQICASTFLYYFGQHSNIASEVDAAGGAQLILKYVCNALAVHSRQPKVLRATLPAVQVWIPVCPLEFGKRYIGSIVITLQSHQRDATIQAAGCIALEKFALKTNNYFTTSPRQLLMDAGAITVAIHAVKMHPKDVSVAIAVLKFLAAMAPKKKAVEMIKANNGDRVMYNTRRILPAENQAELDHLLANQLMSDTRMFY